MQTLELLPEAEQKFNENEAEQLVLSALQRQLIERGDHQLPDEPNRGFTIEHVRGGPHRPVPVEAAFPRDDDHRAKDFARQFIDGTTPIEIVEDAWTGVKSGEPGFAVYFPIANSKYQEAVAAGKAPADLFGADGNVSHTKPGAEILDTLVTPEQKRARVEAYYHVQSRAVQRNYVDDLEGIESPNDLPDLTEAYELVDGGRSTRLLNFSPARLSEEQLRQTVNAVRASADKSGGEIFDTLRTISILPEDHPTLSKTASDEDGNFELPYSGEARGAPLYISDRAFQQPEDRKPRSERIERYWRKYFDQYRMPGEPTEGPGSPKDAATTYWEGLLAHELEHAALPSNDVALPEPGPTLYSRVRKGEQEAELAAIEHMGGEDALAVPEDQRQAKQEMWQRHRGSDDGGRGYKQPLGPHFVTCRELDLTQGPLPARLKYPGRPLATEVTYTLVPDA